MDIFTSAMEEIAKAIKITFDIQKDKLSYDKSMMSCVVKQSLGNNRYKVEKNGQEYSCLSLDSKTYQINDKVLVLKVENVEENKIIMGKVG